MNFNNQFVNGTVSYLNNNIILINGSINTNNGLIIASNPSDNLINYSGTNLPFPNYEIAFENTKNKHDIINKSFNIKFKYPNSYYDVDTLIPPALFFILKNNNDKQEYTVRVDLINNCKLKTLYNRNTYHDPFFYDDKNSVLPKLSAEKNMYNYAEYKKINNKA
tara:strand:+ start:1021 stop:1512 length:492 start_codon:yes stop_codon:yes gene_type:complete